MNPWGVYAVRGKFTKGMPGDGITGHIVILPPADADSPMEGLGAFHVIIGGRKGSFVRTDLETLEVTPVGAVKFRVASELAFAGFLSGETISGSLRKERPGNSALTGTWTGTRVQESAKSEEEGGPWLKVPKIAST
jgi:hypothetical protein